MSRRVCGSDPTFASWNQIRESVKLLDALQHLG